MRALIADPDHRRSDGWSEYLSDASARRRKRRRPPTARMTMVDGSPLRTTQSQEFDVDGDLFPWFRLEDNPDAQMLGLIQAGHGFNIEETAGPGPVTTSCRYCGGPLYPLNAAPEWYCEFGERPQIDCQCNWCCHRNLWLLGRYRGKGRPRIQCGSVECKRALAAERKRRSRARSRQHPKTGVTFNP